MNNKLMDILYDIIKDKNLYNYDNDKELENACITEYVNILGDKVIDIALEHEVYTISCIKSFADEEEAV